MEFICGRRPLVYASLFWLCLWSQEVENDVLVASKNSMLNSTAEKHIMRMMQNVKGTIRASFDLRILCHRMTAPEECLTTLRRRKMRRKKMYPSQEVSTTNKAT